MRHGLIGFVLLHILGSIANAQAVHIRTEFKDRSVELSSGTIVAVHNGQSLVVGCGHAFEKGDVTRIVVSNARARLLASVNEKGRDLSLLLVDHVFKDKPAEIAEAAAGTRVGIAGFGDGGTKNFWVQHGVLQEDTRWVSGTARLGDSGGSVGVGNRLHGVISASNPYEKKTWVTRGGEVVRFCSQYMPPGFCIGNT